MRNVRKFNARLGKGTKDAVFQRSPEGKGATITGLAAFRTGTFADSKGNEDTWTTEDLDRMVENFSHLQEDRAFVDVPMRDDHSESIRNVVGYLTNVYRDGELLMVDVDLTEPDAADRYENGTYRARSAEIGSFPDAEDEWLEDVLVGLAFVDIGAVSHLYTIKRDETNDDNPQGDPVVEYTEDDMKREFARGRDQGLTEGLSQAKPAPAAKFRIAGEETSDLTAVQAALDAYETEKAEASVAARKAFVNGLVQRNVIAAPDAEAQTEFALGLSDEQFAAFEALHADAQPAALFQKFDHSPIGGSTVEESDELQTARTIVANHRRAGVEEEDIKQTHSYKRLVALTNGEEV